MPPLRSRLALRPAHAGGLPCMGVWQSPRLLNLGNLSLPAIIVSMLVGEEGWGAVVSFHEVIILQKETAKRNEEDVGDRNS